MMPLLDWIWNEATHYGALTWMCFVAVAFASARFGGLLGVLGGIGVVGAAVLIFDVNWVWDQMQNHPENGKDADMMFFFATFFRATIFNLMLSPVSVIGWRAFVKSRQKSQMDAAAKI